MSTHHAAPALAADDALIAIDAAAPHQVLRFTRSTGEHVALIWDRIHGQWFDVTAGLALVAFRERYAY